MWLPDFKDSPLPTYLALVEAIATAIGCGELRPGERLPPQRRLAWAMGINPSTVMLAYREAARRHLVSGEVGRGTYVLAGSREASLFRLRQPSGLIDLSTNVPVHDPDNRDLADSLAELAGRGELNALLAYPSAALVERAHLAGANWLRQRGLELEPDGLVLCAGAQQGVSAALLALCEAGEPILVERFSAPGIKAAARQLRLPLHGVAMDERGILPDDLDRQARATGARVVVLTPCLQNPTGATLDAERRAAVAEVARRHGLWLVEDDVYGVLGSEAPLAARIPERCLLISSLSKSVAPGLRVGFIGGAGELLERIDREAQATRWAVAPLSLALACEWIEDGTAARRLHWQRQELQLRWRLTARVLGARMPAGRVVAPHLWLDNAPPGLTEACRQQGVEVVPASVFAVDASPATAVRVSLAAAASRAELKQALERIVAAWPL
ncbi:PLP-dependent aminotransferase family protein [Pseudomonas sp. NCCP-436]|uniref:aminotransferase-like domain-containing protein n=1 Tax=Pseudomonas sp. NCCP-436 TaxID=2842481 RepID=UPI001C7E8AD0|nr:PLP-dependent aminotransferase family protein [Pseudomonas sp. NCCP-436]GIZ11553.1 GntR family transcriptional regulator [Pseudomonas sp. NCCP-436]